MSWETKYLNEIKTDVVFQLMKSNYLDEPVA